MNSSGQFHFDENMGVANAGTPPVPSVRSWAEVPLTDAERAYLN